MRGEPAKRHDRIVGRSGANRKAVDFMPVAIGGLIIAHQCLRQAMADDLAVQVDGKETLSKPIAPFKLDQAA